MKSEYLALYLENLYRQTRLFDGIDEVLTALEQRAIPWGIVTNKHSRFTTPLLAELKLLRRTHCAIFGDSVAQAKPHPDGLFAAAREMDLTPSPRIAYVGDDERDIRAALAANMTPVAARYGYLGNGIPLAQWGAKLVIDSPRELLRTLGIE